MSNPINHPVAGMSIHRSPRVVIIISEEMLNSRVFSGMCGEDRAGSWLSPVADKVPLRVENGELLLATEEGPKELKHSIGEVWFALIIDRSKGNCEHLVSIGRLPASGLPPKKGNYECRFAAGEEGHLAPEANHQ